ncbi:unnamed protein product [marine sediment metagenome]|uniref:Uncharacterized protein n=1 Tax=marine sediment metagenome TaxID=412755 RepID=X0UR26_9ZZZZ
MTKEIENYILGDPGHRVTKRAARCRPAFQYKQPRRRKLEPTEQTFGTLRSLASRMCTQKEAAAILQVHVDTLQKFFRANPEAREAWGEGKELGRAQLRMLLWQQAVDNPAQARFLAKQKTWLGYQDNPATAKVDVTVKDCSEAERRARIQELQERLLKTTASSDTGSG